MKNQLLLEAPKQDHEIIITEIEAADKLMKDTTELSKWRRVKAHIKRNKAAYIAGAIGVGTAITASLVIKNQHDQINKLENMTDLMSEMIVELMLKLKNSAQKMMSYKLILRIRLKKIKT